VFLLVLAHIGSTRQRAVKWLLLSLRRCPTGKDIFEGVWPIEKHRKAQNVERRVRVSGAKKRTDVNIYTLYDWRLHKELSFVGCDDSTCVKIFSGINFINHNEFLNALMHSLTY